jgi:2-oxo-4-hydroxy-4-carboxy-5-ureidoimidazoline decarboxylase
LTNVPELTLADFNTSSEEDAKALLRACLDIESWVDAVAARRPYSSHGVLMEAASDLAAEITWPEVAGALDRHPRIGQKKSAAEQTAAEASWSKGEQSGVAATDAEALAAGNAAYEIRFGYIFLICATGMSGAEILAGLQDRLGNDPEREQTVVIGELRKIADVRLAKAIGS